MRPKWLAIILLTAALAGLLLLLGPGILHRLRFRVVPVRTESLMGTYEVSNRSGHLEGPVRIWDIASGEVVLRWFGCALE